MPIDSEERYKGAVEAAKGSDYLENAMSSPKGIDPDTERERILDTYPFEPDGVSFGNDLGKMSSWMRISLGTTGEDRGKFTAYSMGEKVKATFYYQDKHDPAPTGFKKIDVATKASYEQALEEFEDFNQNGNFQTAFFQIVDGDVGNKGGTYRAYLCETADNGVYMENAMNAPYVKVVKIEEK